MQLKEQNINTNLDKYNKENVETEIKSDTNFLAKHMKNIPKYQKNKSLFIDEYPYYRDLILSLFIPEQTINRQRKRFIFRELAKIGIDESTLEQYANANQPPQS